MTGALTINLTSGALGLKVMQTLSGNILHAEKGLTSSGTLIAVGNITARGTFSGNILHVEKGVTSSGTILAVGSVSTRGTLSGAALTIMNTTSYVMGSVGIGKTAPSTKLDVVGTISGSNLTITRGISGANIFATKSISGTHLYASSTFNGAGLTDCDTASTSKLLWDSATKVFSCGTDQNVAWSGTGAL